MKNLKILIYLSLIWKILKIGLLKMDFLSLVNLDLLNDMVKRTNIRLEDIPSDDKKTFEIYNMGIQ